MSQSPAFTKTDLHTCCANALNDNGRVNVMAAYIDIRDKLPSVTKRGAETITTRIQRHYPTAWKAADPIMQHGKWTIALDKAETLFSLFDPQVRKAFGLPLAILEVPARKKKQVTATPVAMADDVHAMEVDSEEQQEDPVVVPEVAETAAEAQVSENPQLVDELMWSKLTAEQYLRFESLAKEGPVAEVGGSGEGSAASTAPGPRPRVEVDAADIQGSVLTEQQAANVSKNLAIVDPFEEAYRKSRKSSTHRTMVVVKDMIGHLYNIDEKQATKKLENLRSHNPSHSSRTPLDLRECEKNDIFQDLPLVTAKCTTHATYCNPGDLLRWFIDIDEAKALGISHHMKNTFIRSLGGDESMIAELQVTAKATAGTIIASIARSEERDQIGHMTAVNPSGSVLTEQQAANVTQEQDFVQKWEKATAHHRLKLDNMELVYVPHVIADLFFNGDTTLASTAIRDWHFTDPAKSGMRESLMPKKDEKGSFHKVSNPRNPNTKVFACKPLDLIEFLLQSPAAKRFGLNKLSTVNLVRKLGGDPSLHAEIDTNAQASEGTSIHRLARTADVGSSSTSALLLTPPAPPSRKPRQPRPRLGFYLYAGKNGAYIKIGYTSNLIDRTSAYDGDILVAFEDYSPEGEALFKAWETRLLRLIPDKYRVPGKDEHFYLEGLCEFFGIAVSDPEVFFKVAFACIAPFGDNCQQSVLRVLNEDAGMFDRLDTDEAISAFALRMGRAAPLSRKRKRADDIEAQMRALTLREETKRHKVEQETQRLKLKGEQEQETQRLKHKVEQEEETQRLKHKELINTIVQTGNVDLIKMLLEKVHV